MNLDQFNNIAFAYKTLKSLYYAVITDSEGKIVFLLLFIAFCMPLLVVSQYYFGQGQPLHKGLVGGWSLEGHCHWPNM